MDATLTRRRTSRGSTAPSTGSTRTRLGLVSLMIMTLFIAACGTTIDSEEGLEPLATATVEVQDAAEGVWNDLDGLTVEAPLDLRLDVSGNPGELIVELDGVLTVAELEGAPYAFSLSEEQLPEGQHTLRIHRFVGNGARTKLVDMAEFQVVAASKEQETEPDGDDTTGDTTEEIGSEEDTEDTAGPESSDDETSGDDTTTDDTTTDETTTDETTNEETTNEEDAAEDVWSGPIVITEGGTYSGRWESLESSTPAVTVKTSEPVLIENSTIRSAGHLISAPWASADLTVRNVAGEGLYPTVVGRPAGRFMHVEGYKNVTVENSYMDGTSGIYLNTSDEGATVRIVGNRAHDIDGRRADGLGGYDGAAYVQFVQLNKGYSLRASEIAWNEVINRPYESRVEDVISVYKTSGRAGDPLRIHSNYIEGAFAADPATDGYSGGGIMLGDAGGAYLHAYQNRVVATSNYGVAISGGHDNRIDDNVVVACGQLSDGTPIAAQNVGMYVWDMRDDETFANNGGSGNQVAWAHPDHVRNDWWTPDANDWSGNEKLYQDVSISCSFEADTYAAWLQEVDQVEASVGLVSSN